MEIINTIFKFCNSQFVSTILGVVVGGLITIKINRITEQKKIQMQLKIQLWNLLSTDLDLIKNYIRDLENELEFNTMWKSSLNKHLQLLVNESASICTHLSKNRLIILSERDFTLEFDELLKEIVEHVVKCNEDEANLDNKILRQNLKKLKDELFKLYAVLQLELLNCLYEKVEINKMLKKSIKKVYN